MLNIPQKDQVIEGVRRGRYSLLLGAGFSADSVDSSGAPIPVGDTLRDELADHFGLPRHYPLQVLTGAISAKDLNKYFEKRFSKCRASEGARLVSQFVWRSIYSFNIDDVLVDAYAHKAAQQQLSVFTHRDPHQAQRDPRELFAIHLHGSTTKPTHGYVFSTKDYGASSAQDSVWFKIASDELVMSPFIIVGFSLNESDLEYYLARRSSISSESQQIAPSLFVTNHLDPIRLAACERFGLLPVVASSSDFFAQLAKEAMPIPTVLDLILPASKDAPWIRETPPDDLRIFYRQWLQVARTELPAPTANESPRHLLEGVEPRWYHVAENQDLIRRTEREVVASVTAWASAPAASRVCVLASDPGEGKSTALKRIALEAANSGILTFYFNAQERLLSNSAFAVISRIKSPVLVVIDQLAEHGHQFADLYERLVTAGTKVFALCAERRQRLHRVADSLMPLGHTETSLRHLDTSEAAAMAAKLRDLGLLGRNARSTNADLGRSLKNESLLVALVTLNRQVRHLDDLIVSELKELSEAGRLVYSLFSVAHATGHPLKMAVAQRASGIESRPFLALFKEELRGLLRGLPPAGEYREARHRVIAEAVTKQIGESARFDAFVRLAEALAPYVNTKTLTDGTPEARISARLLDFDDSVEPNLGGKAEAFYNALKGAWGWNSRYWDQLALMRLDKDPTRALAHAEQAVGIERHPLTLTTLAKVQFRLARIQAGTTHGKKYVDEAINSVQAAIDMSARRRRREIHAFDLGIHGIVEYARAAAGKGPLKLEKALAHAGDEFLGSARKWFSEKQLERLTKKWSSLKQESI